MLPNGGDHGLSWKNDLDTQAKQKLKTTNVGSCCGAEYRQSRNTWAHSRRVLLILRLYCVHLATVCFSTIIRILYKKKTHSLKMTLQKTQRPLFVMPITPVSAIERHTSAFTPAVQYCHKVTKQYRIVHRVWLNLRRARATISELHAFSPSRTTSRKAISQD